MACLFLAEVQEVLRYMQGVQKQDGSAVYQDISESTTIIIGNANSKQLKAGFSFHSLLNLIFIFHECVVTRLRLFVDGCGAPRLPNVYVQ